MDPPQTPSAEEFAQLTHYAGFDWGKNQHQITVVDRDGHILLELCFEDTAAGWAALREKLKHYPHLGVAIETSCGPAVERLLESGWRVYPLNPHAAKSFRERRAPSGAKSDRLDAWCFADALRTDGHGWRLLQSQDPLTHELRLLCRDEISLIEQRTALINRLQEALHEYYPAALEAFDDWVSRAAWAFVIAFPTPQKLAQAGKRRWENFLHKYKLYRPQTAPRRLELFAHATEFVSPNAAVTSAKSFLAVALAKQLRVLEDQLNEYRRRIEQLFADHPDHDLFGSLPGAGPKLAPRLLAELGGNRSEFSTPEALQCYAGTAPVTKQSVRPRHVVMRRACNHGLRAAVHLWADHSRHACVWAQAYYEQKRAEGLRHAAALRCLGQRWLKILWRMWQDGTCYDEARHMRDQVKHGSWVVALNA